MTEGTSAKHRAAVDAARAALSALGFDDADTAPAPTRGPVHLDLRAAAVAVAVRGEPTSRRVVERTVGAAEGRVPVVLSQGGFSRPALDAAAQHGVALFEFDPATARIEPRSEGAEELERERP